MKILFASSICSEAIERLRANHDVICAFNADEEELLTRIADREVLVFRSGVQVTSSVMEHAPNLKLIIRAGSGLDNIDPDYVRQRGCRLVRIPGPAAKAVAELTFGLMLGLARRIREADHLLRQGTWAKDKLTGSLLSGKTLGIVGVGNIGSRVGKLGAAWGMNIIGCVESPSPGRAVEFRQAGVRLTSLDAVLAQGDYVTIHVPLKASTQYLIHAENLSLMKQEAVLLNLARGGVVNEWDLYKALTEGRIRGAALDVHEREGDGKISPLAKLDNVLLTPHIGAGTSDTQREIGELVTETIDKFPATPPGVVPVVS